MAFLRAKGVQCYGVGPMVDEEDASKGFGAHSDQERLLEEALYKHVQFFWNAVTSIAARASSLWGRLPIGLDGQPPMPQARIPATETIVNDPPGGFSGTRTIRSASSCVLSVVAKRGHRIYPGRSTPRES